MKIQSYFTTNHGISRLNHSLFNSILREARSYVNFRTNLKKALQALLKSFMLITQSQNRLPSVETRINLYTANSSTPFKYRAFFVCKLRTSKISLAIDLFSMVGRIGQRLIVGCIPCIAVFHPDMSYRQAWKLAVVPKILNTELLAMTTYLFAGIVRTDLSNKIHTLRIDANSLLEARAKLAKTYVLVCIGKLPHSRTNQVAEVANG